MSYAYAGHTAISGRHIDLPEEYDGDSFDHIE